MSICINRSARRTTLMVAMLALFAVASKADVLKEIEYRAFCLNERVSLGGWLSFRSDAEEHRRNHLQSHPDHQVVIQENDYS